MNYMSKGNERKVGERGQVTIPKNIREKEGIRPGDEVEVVDREGSILVRKKPQEEELKEGYRRMARRDKKVGEEMLKATEEALE